jgi:hypothetical protein
MGKRGRVLVVALAAALLAVMAWTVLRAPASVPEPVYNGKPLSYWLHVYRASFYGGRPNPAEAKAAIDEIGTNSIPTLLRMLRTHDSPLKSRLRTWASWQPFLRIHFTSASDLNLDATCGFFVLGGDARNAVPKLVKILDQNVSPESEGCTAMSLACIGPGAKAAVPSLIRAATSGSPLNRGRAINALGSIHADSDSVVPVLVEGLRDENLWIQLDALGAIGQFRKEATSAVPILVDIIKDPKSFGTFGSADNQVTVDKRTPAENALQQIDPETYARVVTNAVPVSTK